MATVLMLGLWVVGLGQGKAPKPEYELKAYWIYQFAKYTDWLAAAPSNGAPYRLLLVGRFEDPASLTDLHNQQLKEGRLTVETRKSVDSKKDLEGYHIVVISKAVPTEFIQSILEDLRGASVLTVGEEEGFTDKGGVISMVIRGDDIFFEVSRTSATSANLAIKEEFLKTISVKLIARKKK